MTSSKVLRKIIPGFMSLLMIAAPCFLAMMVCSLNNPSGPSGQGYQWYIAVNLWPLYHDALTTTLINIHICFRVAAYFFSALVSQSDSVILRREIYLHRFEHKEHCRFNQSSHAEFDIVTKGISLMLAFFIPLETLVHFILLVRIQMF